MDLHLALLVLGIVLIALIFVLSRYPSVIDNIRRKWLEKRAQKNRETELQTRDVERAPRFDGSTSEAEQFDSPLFDFSNRTDEDDQWEAGNQLLVDEIAPETTAQMIDSPVVSQHVEVDSQAALQADLQADSENVAVETTAATLQEADETVPSGPFTSLRQIDYWIKLSPVDHHTQAEIAAMLDDWGDITFPVQLHALTLDNPQWVGLLDSKGETKIMDVVASYQLLDKGRATTLEDLTRFDALVSALGETIGAEKLMMATPEQAAEQSQRLATFHRDSCEPLEVTISAPKSQAFMGKLVETSAKQQGLEFKDGEYVRLKKMGAQDIVIYRMISADLNKFDQDMSSDAKIERVLFTMTPALSPSPGRDAKEMLDAVKAFASRVKGEIRVPGKPEFHLDQLLNLRNRVSQLERSIASAGLEPGGQEMYRIFNQ